MGLRGAGRRGVLDTAAQRRNRCQARAVLCRCRGMRCAEVRRHVDQFGQRDEIAGKAQGPLVSFLAMMDKVHGVGGNATFRLSGRRGDYLAFARCHGPLAPDGHAYDLTEIWRLADGDQVLVTTRYQDLPDWFQLHPLETSGEAARAMKKRLDDGYTPPDEPMETVNLVRVRAGDRLLWLGDSRPGTVSDGGILAVFDIQQDAVVVGEPIKFSDDGMPHFGTFLEEPPPEDLGRLRSAWARMASLRAPRVVSFSDWRIGS